MSENVELVRSIYADWERGDYSRADWADGELELVVPDGPEPDRWKGLAAAREVWLAYLRTWDELRSEAVELRELDGGRVLVLAHNRGIGRASGVELAPIGQVANVFHIRDGKVTRIDLYFSREQALADCGA